MSTIKMPSVVSRYYDTSRQWSRIRLWRLLTFRFKAARQAKWHAVLYRDMAEQGEREGFLDMSSNRPKSVGVLFTPEIEVRR